MSLMQTIVDENIRFLNCTNEDKTVKRGFHLSGDEFVIPNIVNWNGEALFINQVILNKDLFKEMYKQWILEDTNSNRLEVRRDSEPPIDIVICGECIHHDDGICRRPKWAMGVEPTGFCSYGERRTDLRSEDGGTGMKVINIKDFCIPAQDADYDELSNFADEIAELATYPIDAEPVRRGRWEYRDAPVFGNPYGSYECSECGNGEPHKTRYCSNCGAKMEEQE